MPVTPSTSTSSELPSSRRLQREIAGGDVVRQGDAGASVREAQQLLRAHGFYPGRVDGDMGQNTTRAVRAFQRSRGIDVDGIIGTDTLRELRTPTRGVDQRRGADRGVDASPPDRVPGQSGADLRRRDELDRARRAREREREQPTDAQQPGGAREATLAPRGASEREKFDHYAAIVKANGGEVNPNGKPTVLAIRGMDINGRKHATTSNRAYDDTFVVLTADKRVLELKGATHAGQATSSLARDDWNGTRGVGMINPGNYSVSPNGPHHGRPSFRVANQDGSGGIKGTRDTNGDGRFSDAERAASARRNDRLSGVLFHVGFENSPRSIGCLTMSPSTYSQFLSRVGQNGFNFSLVQA